MKLLSLKEWSEYKNITLQGHYKDPEYLINVNISIDLSGEELFKFLNNEFDFIDEDLSDEGGIIECLKCIHEDISFFPCRWVLKLED